jgi:hypothetical protein
MAQTYEDLGKQFVRDNKDVTTVSSLMNHQNSAGEEIADHFNAFTKGWNADQKLNLCEAIAKNSSPNDYASFSVNKETHHLQVTTRAFDSPINFGVSQTEDFQDLCKTQAGKHQDGTLYQAIPPIYTKSPEKP